MSVREDLDVGSVVLDSVTASDEDMGQNAVISYNVQTTQVGD